MPTCQIDEAAINGETNLQANKMKEISSEEKEVKHVETPETSKPCG